MLKTEKELIQVESSASKELRDSKSKLENLQLKLEAILNKIEQDIDDNKKLTKKILMN